MRPRLFRPITIPNQYQEHLKVADLFTHNGEWNWPLIQTMLWVVDIIKIKRIPLGGGSGNDKLIWHYNSKGDYTVKCGYFLTQMDDESSSIGCQSILHVGLKRLWNLRIPNKIKIHFLRCLVNALPVKTNLDKRGISVNVLYTKCLSQPEHIDHIFWYCNYARKILKKSSIWSTVCSFKSQDRYIF